MPPKRKFADFSLEIPYWNTNTYVIGVDEVGRGCLAGPVHVGGVCFPLLTLEQQKKVLKHKIHDSKQCPEKKRALLSPIIKEVSQCWHIESGSAEEINAKGIIYSLEMAACRVVEHISSTLPSTARIMVFTDSLPIKALKKAGKYPQEPILKGDSKSVSIAAASIIAKVERDTQMEQLHSQYPVYYWKENKGYATKAHRDALIKYGKCPLHRNLYLRKLLGTSL